MGKPTNKTVTLANGSVLKGQAAQRYGKTPSTPNPTAPILESGMTPENTALATKPLRYTSPGQDATMYNGNPIAKKPILATVNENSIREETRSRMQASVDAINAETARMLAQEKVLGEDRSGQTRAINARSGLMGSDFGVANQEKTTQYNKQQEQYVADQQNMKLQSVLLNIEDRASAEIDRRKQEALGKYQMEMGDYERARESARADFQTLAQAGVDLGTLNPAQKAALFKQSGYDESMGELIYNAMKPKPKQIDYQSMNVGGGRVLFYGVDPATGELKQQIVDVGLPDEWSMTIAPDGTPIAFNKNTGESQLLSEQGAFAKPADALEQTKTMLEIKKLQNEIEGRGDLLPTEKDRAAFNQIVGKYNASPLIQASDRTIVLKNTVNAVRQDPSNASKQLSLAYGFIQALDSYQSAVREGELSLINSIDSKVGQLQNYVQQIQNGQTVRPEVAKQIADVADNLVNYISEGAAKKEELFRSQARVNGIEQAWDSFRGGFVTNYDDPASDTDLSSLWNETTGGKTLDVNKAFNSGGLSFDKVGNTSASGNQVKGTQQTLSKIPFIEPTPKTSSPITSLLTKKFPEGYNGGQCGDFARKLANSMGVNYPRLGDSLQEKINAVRKHGTSVSNAKIGSVIVTKENPTYGHVATIIGKNSKGWVVVESNFKQSNKVSYGRTIPFNSAKIIGVINPTKA
jgi:surface antigen